MLVGLTFQFFVGFLAGCGFTVVGFIILSHVVEYLEKYHRGYPTAKWGQAEPPQTYKSSNTDP